MPTEQSTGNGRTTGNGRSPSAGRTAALRTAGSDVLDTDQLLAVLTAVRKGDFSLKMPMSQVGVAGKIADALNDIIELNRETAQRARAGEPGGRQGGQDHPAGSPARGGGSLGGLGQLGQHADRRPGPARPAKWPA